MIRSRLYAFSLQGRKPDNQDSYLTKTVDQNLLVLVADGVGGHQNGAYASQRCVEILDREFSSGTTSSDPATFLRRATLSAAGELYDLGKCNPAYLGCGTTLTGFLICDSKGFILNVGDSRVYRKQRSGSIEQLTRDHTIVQDQIDLGLLTKEIGKFHPDRNIMTSAIGQPLSAIRIDVDEIPIPGAGDILLACSDGLHSVLSDEDISNALASGGPDRYAEAVVYQAYEKGSVDNITACIAVFE